MTPAIAVASLALAIAVADAPQDGAAPASGDVGARVAECLDRWLDAQHRSADSVARELIGLGATAEPALCSLLERRAAPIVIGPIASALARIGTSDRARSALAGLLGATDVRCRVAAASGLGRIRARESVPLLVTALDDPEPEVREEAIAAILRQVRRNADQDVASWFTGHRVASAPARAILERLPAAAGIARETVSAVERVLADADEDAGEERIRRLIAIGNEDVLVDSLPDADAEDLPVVAMALAGVGSSSDAVDALIALLADAGSRPIGIAALGVMAERATACRSVVAKSVGALDDPAREVRVAAVTVLLDVCARRPELELFAWHESHFRGFVHHDQLAVLLGRLGTPEARRVLLSMVARWDDPAIVLDGLRGMWLGGQPEDAAAVLETLRHVDVAVRRKACLVLGRLRARAALRPLIDLLDQPHAGLRADAHWALCRITGMKLAADPALWESWWQRGGKDGT